MEVPETKFKKRIIILPPRNIKNWRWAKATIPFPRYNGSCRDVAHKFEVDFNEFDCDGIEDMANGITLEKVDIQEQKQFNNITIGNDKDFSTEVPKDDIEPKSKLPFTTPKKSMKKTPKTNKDYFNFGEASYADMHSFRGLENERLEKEHELRMKNMAEIHSQVMINLKLQTDILVKTLRVAEK